MAADRETIGTGDARAALDSAAAMEAAAERRGAWPGGFAFAVAAAFGVNGVILALGQTWTHRLLATAAVLAAMALVIGFRRRRGAALRGEWRRLALATLINVGFILFSSLPRGPLAFGGAGPFLYGAAEMLAVLIGFAIIALFERRRAEAGR